MKSFIRRAIVKVAQRMPTIIKAKLLSISSLSRIRDAVYKGSPVEPFAIPGLPYRLILYVRVNNPGERAFITTRYETHVVQYLMHTIANDWVALDIGAFIGFYTVLLAKLCGKGLVIAFEPVEELANRILLSARANNLANVRVEPVAVGASPGVRPFWIHDYGDTGYGTSSFLVWSSGKRAVQQRTKQLSRVDFIKIDVEGAELDVLIGARETLERFRPIVLVECNTTEDREQVEKFFFVHGFACKELGRTTYGVHIVATAKSRKSGFRTTNTT